MIKPKFLLSIVLVFSISNILYASNSQDYPKILAQCQKDYQSAKNTSQPYLNGSQKIISPNRPSNIMPVYSLNNPYTPELKTDPRITDETIKDVLRFNLTRFNDIISQLSNKKINVAEAKSKCSNYTGWIKEWIKWMGGGRFEPNHPGGPNSARQVYDIYRATKKNESRTQQEIR